MEKHIDILIVGAGISGIGLAVHLSKHCPQRQFDIIERRESFVALGIFLNTQVFVLTLICRLLALILSLGKKPMFLPMGLQLKAIFRSTG